MRVKKTKEAARAREKQKTVAAQAIDPTDPEYAPPSDEENITVPLAARKRRHDNSDLYETTGKRSRTSTWRDENQITKKARIINAQPSIAKLFKPVEKKPIEMKQPAQVHSSGEVEVHIFQTKCVLRFGLFYRIHDTQPHVLGPSSSSKLQAAECAPVDSDSDIEMISAPDPTPLDLPESLLSVPPIDDTPGPFKSPLTSESDTTASAPAPASDPESDDGYSTGDSDNDKKTHELSLTAIEATFKRFEVKIQKYRKAHLSARALTAMTPEKGAQRMVMVNGLTEFNTQRRKREIERVNLALKIDNAPRSQWPKLLQQDQVLGTEASFNCAHLL
ncbi:hypothetical protein DFH07DRAFT_766147 [Mycena maculata]|uniref:Uncharacterized protein n=1 Tax=Mycena maculata TaxID=230809 RepID=A0AAD7NVS2_9AGAR|nr:hypothetical protein DFH07DRAFT_766147 [Mycena maculata]